MRKLPEPLLETRSQWRHNTIWCKLIWTRKRKSKYSVLVALLLFFLLILVTLSSKSSRDQQRQEVIEHFGAGVVTDIRQLKYRLWPDDPQCQNHVVQFIRNCDRPPMALASYPCSGNTLVRGIIERLTGYFTGSVYSDVPLYISGLLGFSF